jgi:Holliday junction resolvase RusA-like endonuclease
MESVVDGYGYQWYALKVNPEPWAVGPLDLGRKNGKVYATIGRNQQLAAYQDAIREELGDGHELIEGPVQLTFFFWRQRSAYTTPNQQQHRKHQADATNLGKALEDALQGVLFVNDKEVNDVRNVIVEQGPDVEGMILIRIKASSNPPNIVSALPTEVLALVEMLENPLVVVEADQLKYTEQDVPF